MSRRRMAGRPSSTRGLTAAGVGAAVGIGAAAVVAAPFWGLMVYGAPIGAFAGAVVGIVTWWAVHAVLGSRVHVRTGRLRLAAALLIGTGLPAVAVAGALPRPDDPVSWAVLCLTATVGAAGAVAEHRCGADDRRLPPRREALSRAR